MELRESTQYPAQGTRDCLVGEFRQHVVPSPRGMFLHIAVQQCIYQYVLVCTGMYMLKLYFLCSMPTLRISKLWPTCQIIRTYSYASCDFMHVLATFSITRPCSRKFISIPTVMRPKRSQSISTRLRNVHLLTAITMFPVNQGFYIHPSSR